MQLIVASLVVLVTVSVLAVVMLPRRSKIPVNYHNGFEGWLPRPLALTIFGCLEALGIFLMRTDGGKGVAGAIVLIGITVFLPIMLTVAVLQARTPEH